LRLPYEYPEQSEDVVGKEKLQEDHYQPLYSCVNLQLLAEVGLEALSVFHHFEHLEQSHQADHFSQFA